MHKIESLDHYGRGITKVNDKTTFVENALPSEIVELKTNIEKKKYTEASVLKYIKKSSKRVNPKCPYYELCGGCNLMHLSYLDQLKFKQNKIENIVHKYLNKDVKIKNIIKSDDIFNYRNKVTFQVKEKIGFYKDNSYDLICIDNCLIVNDLINNSINYLKKLNLKNINKIICRTGCNKLMIVLETTNKNLNTRILQNIASSIYLKINNEYIHVFGDKEIYEKINDYKYLISPDSFFQINIGVCTKLYEKIKEYIGTQKSVLDLYCGTGSIGIYVSKNNNVVGIEKNKYAVENANENKVLNKLSSIRFICGDSGKMLKGLDFKPDIIILDPPRSGLNKETINNVINFKPQKIVYVSCDPMTLVRDLNILKNNYSIKEITPFDMFPNTYHTECLCILENK